MKNNAFIAIVYNAVTDDAAEDERDVLQQVEAVSKSLENLCYRYDIIPVTTDIQTFIDTIQRISPDIVFNLVESFAHHDRLIHIIPDILDTMGVVYTGVSADGLYCTTNKILTKQILSAYGINTPVWQRCDSVQKEGIRIAFPCIMKAVSCDASQGISDQSMITSGIDCANKIAALSPDEPKTVFVEEFIEGREFNVSLIGPAGCPEVLPLAEMTFLNYPAGKPTIVNYKAKWDHNSFEYHNTVRKFSFTPEQTPLLQTIQHVAVQCWNVFNLSGYARVDMRIDDKNVPWILEINANPCISPDSGFTAAAQQAGYSYDQMIAKIISSISP